MSRSWVHFVIRKDGLTPVPNRYLVGVYDMTTQRVRLYNAPTHLMSRTVKALKSRAKPSTATQTEYRAARNQLGEVFGSKKAIKAIRTAERNEVDVSALQGVVSHVQNEIDVGTSALPSQGSSINLSSFPSVYTPDIDEMKEANASARPIPPVNEEATKPSEVDLTVVIYRND